MVNLRHKGAHAVLSSSLSHTPTNKQLLAKTPRGGKAIGDGDLFSANATFSCPKRVFLLQLPDVKRAHEPAKLEVCVREVSCNLGVCKKV